MFFTALPLAISLFAPSSQEAPFVLLELQHDAGDGQHAVRVRGDGSPFAVLRLDGRVPYLWPLCGPGGVEMTRAYPMGEGRTGEAKDHPHHQSQWFTHGSVDDHDFWHDPECRIVLDGEPQVKQAPGLFEVEITLPLVWKGPDARAVLHEKRIYRFAARHAVRLVEFESTLTAPPAEVEDEGVLFGDTKEGSFGLRVRPELRLKGSVAAGTILNSEGLRDGDCWGQRARWVSYDAPLGAGRVSVTLMDHGRNLRHPTWWHARDYGLVAANPFGVHDFEGAAKGAGDFRLPAGESLTQRYLVVLAAGEADGAARGEPSRALSASTLEGLYLWWNASRQ